MVTAESILKSHVDDCNGKMSFFVSIRCECKGTGWNDILSTVPEREAPNLVRRRVRGVCVCGGGHTIKCEVHFHKGSSFYTNSRVLARESIFHFLPLQLYTFSVSVWTNVIRNAILCKACTWWVAFYDLFELVKCNNVEGSVDLLGRW